MRLQKSYAKKITHQQILLWASQQETCCVLDSNAYLGKDSRYGCIVAVGVAQEFIIENTRGAFAALRKFYDDENDWLFGFLSYDLKNDLENLSSNNTDHLEFPLAYFFKPQKILIIEEDQVACYYMEIVQDEMEQDLKAIGNIVYTHPIASVDIKLQAVTDKEAYLANFTQIKQHLQRGDCYEINYCITFEEEAIIAAIPELFLQINQGNKAPFAAYFRRANQYILSASPERFIKKEKDRIVSQPIKGTKKRATDKEEDRKLKEALQTSRKERTENVMIVDLVRNDLSKIAQRTTVKVEELAAIYSFESVHQMISTVSCQAKPSIHPVDIVASCFPMGSMTGVPKVSVMEIIERTETHKRGVYSGALGYFTPEGDFDFNVLIRTLLYNEQNQRLSVSVGGAITDSSKPEEEYEECLIKLQSIEKFLSKR